MSIKSISDKIYEIGDDRMYQMNDIYYRMAEYIKDINPTLYCEMLEEAEDILYNITEEEAMEKVRNMTPFGERWGMEDVYSFVRSQGEDPCIAWYLVMNMMYNDYYKTANKYNADTPDFYYSLAHDFIHDEDAKSHKVEKYFS